ncbi:MAG: CDP-glycerol glycerophosphotransferase family protein [Verrucomicrobiota bacterium]
MNGFTRNIIRLIHRLCPKRNHAILWGWPDYEDSVIALELALRESNVTRTVLLMSNTQSSPPCPFGQQTLCVKKNSLAGLLWFCSARYVFFTHPCFTRNFPPDVISVNVWHGMPFKKIGWLMSGDEGIRCRYTLATSPFWGDIMERAMKPQGEILAVGLPRNDRLFCDRDSVMDKLNLDSSIRLFAWLPTYRKSVRGFPRTDGIETGSVFGMPDVDPYELNEFLKARGAFLLVKPHPMAAFEEQRAWSNLIVVDESWFKERSLSLYELLGATDLLISDISSVVIDYLLLDRPIIHAFCDLEKYETSRGFTVEPIRDYFVGPVVTEAQQLYQALDRAIGGDDTMSVRRRDIARLSHRHLDAGATSRLLDAIGLRES